jgi:5-methylcytosine-specific restriction endonuclease McrA
VHRVVPFVIRLVDRTQADSDLQPVRVKLDPGSKTTGIALVREDEDGAHVLNLIELAHRGAAISKALTARAALRRGRRNRNTRYRAPRFDNRTKPAGWLAPSLRHRLETTLSWVNRLQRWAPVTGIAQELVRFDMQAMENPDIEGVQYQRGTLAGTEAREYLLAKWTRRCAYCDAENVPLEIEHIRPRANGGTDRVSNLTLACRPCNQRKAAKPIELFLASQPARLRRILAQSKAPLKDAAAVNATRWALFGGLKATGLSVEVGSGGKTKWNRERLGVPKGHALDAACVGDVAGVHGWKRPVLAVKATGRGAYQRTRVNAYGFPRGYLMRQKQVHGFATGDRVKAVVPTGKKAGIHIGRVAVRAVGSFNIQTPTGLVQGIGYRHCRMVQRGDGYGYQHATPFLTAPCAVPYPSPA